MRPRTLHGDRGLVGAHPLLLQGPSGSLGPVAAALWSLRGPWDLLQEGCQFWALPWGREWVVVEWMWVVGSNVCL